MTFKTMLAGTPKKGELIRLPVLASPKLDGVRCHVIGAEPVSRNLLPFRNEQISNIFGRTEMEGMDGEFMVGDPTHPEAFRQTGVLNSFNGDCSQVKLFVFDDFTNPYLPFRQRLMIAEARIKALKTTRLAVVKHKVIESLIGLLEFEAECLDLGYEGIMTRDPEGPYKYGRSTPREQWLLKHKQFLDSEAVIDDVEELMHNDNEKTLVRNGKMVRNGKAEGKQGMNRLGAYHVRDIHTGVKFRVGSGFTDKERVNLWDGANLYIGQVIKYQYFPTGAKEKPRFPTFKGFRDPVDI